MRKFFNFLKFQTFWGFLGIIGLLALIWFIGPEIAISGVKPLASKTVRITVCAVIVLLWLGKILLRQYREARRNALLLKEIKASQEPILATTEDSSAISRQFSEIDTVLKNAKFSKGGAGWFGRFNQGQYLYQMPWYVVLGAAGSGKTTALKQAGLHFPLESTLGSSVSGLAGTRDCDWFLTDEAVLLDTAGRLSLHNEQFADKDAKDWEEFVSLLQRYRPKQPINGVIVTIGVDDLLDGKTNLAEMANSLRKRIHEMHTKLGIQFPVYLMVTKLDLLHGFNEFFAHLDDEERAQYLGTTLVSGTESIPLATTTEGLSAILDRLRNMVLPVINNLDTQAEKNAAFSFPEEFERLNNVLLTLLKNLAKSSKFEQPITWRGIYFTSATQSGQGFNPVLDELGGSFQLTQKYVENERAQTNNKSMHSFFLNKLFTDVVFYESGLASENKAWFLRYQTRYWLTVALLASIVLAGIVLLFSSYLNNSQYLEEVAKQAALLEEEGKQLSPNLDLQDSIAFADKVRNVAQSPHIDDLSSPPLSYRMGLYQGKQIQEVADAAYNRLLQDNTMPLISHQFDNLLRTAHSTEYAHSYDALKAYLMMFDKSHYNADFMKTWLLGNLKQPNGEPLDSVHRQRIDEALSQVLAQPQLAFSLPYDDALVEERRQALSSIDVTEMIADSVLNQIQIAGSEQYTPVSISSMGGSQSHLLFRRKSGRALKEPVNFVYTREVYLNAVLPKLIETAEELYTESNWVLGHYAANNRDKLSALRGAQEIYFNQYIKAWQDYLNDLTLVSPKSNRESIQIAKLLSDKNSSLVNIIRGVSHNTRLRINEQLEQQLNEKTSEQISNWLSRSGLGKWLNADNMPGDELSALTQVNPVDEAFADYHALVVADNDQAASINTVVDAINDLYVYLIAVNLAVDKGVDLPPDDPFVKYKAKVNRLPLPFREPLDHFSEVILKNTDKVIDDRLMSLFEQQLAPLALTCEQMQSQGYPFQVAADNNVALESFNNIFGPNGIYQQFSSLSGQAAALSRSDNLNDVMAKNPAFRNRFEALEQINIIRQTYFNKASGTPHFDFSVKVLMLDPSLESVTISYDGKSQIYTHGPVVPASFTWPAKSEDATMKISVMSPQISSAALTTNGPWSIFRMLEKGRIVRQSENATVVDFKLAGKSVLLEINTSSLKNPLNLNILRNFRCLR